MRRRITRWRSSWRPAPRRRTGRVSFLDKVKGTLVVARKLRWNLKTDRIEVIEPMPTALPSK